jgi:cytochrome c oxidase subunit 2
MKRSPLGYLSHAAGTRADAILPLTRFTLVISIVVCVAIGILLWLAVRRGRYLSELGGSFPAIEPGAPGSRWISIGLIISAFPLTATLVWTLFTLAAIAGPPANPALVLDVTARQWWWDVRYASDEPTQQFSIANEIHIPVGVPVLVRLHAADVIHSFWVPALSGKTDVIPGQTNSSWLQANAPGRYLGQCSEYCGYQHAHMQLEVVAETKAGFDAWRTAQLQEAPAPISPAQTRGAALVEYRCGLCHRVRGTDAGAINAPDLTHLMSRRMLAAGTLLNNTGNLGGWIENPQILKPGSQMPNQFLSAQQLSDTLAYLETLK